MENKKMQSFFEEELLNQFVTRKASESQLETILKAKNDKEMDEWLLVEFFNTDIAPLCNGVIVGKEVKRKDTQEKMYFAASVIDELYRCIIGPVIEPFVKHPNVSIAVGLMAMLIVEHTHRKFFAYACEAVRLEAFAPLTCPPLRPDRVRTLQEECRLMKCEQIVERESKLFLKLCEMFCKP